MAKKSTKQLPEIRERRFKLELYELNEKLELKREGDDKEEKEEEKKKEENNSAQKAIALNIDLDNEKFARSTEVEDEQTENDKDKDEKRKGKVLKPLCELVSFSATFSLNEIPSATVVPAFGTDMMYDAGILTYSRLQQLVIDSTPVGVYLTVIHSTKSFSNKKDKQYWPDETCCIFKGYVQPPVFEITAYNSGRSITLWHWLSSLANISLLTTACDIGNPIETAMQSYYFEPSRVGQVWQPTLTTKVDVSTIWDDAIKILYLDLLDWGNAANLKDKYNPFVGVQRKRLRTVINKIDQDLEVNEKLSNGAPYLNQLICTDIKKDCSSDFVQTDGWSKLISDYFPSYLLAISPQVDKATIIPVPCTINKDEVTEITLSEEFTIQAMPFVAKKISRMTCVAIESQNNNGKPVGTAHYVGLGTYPPKGLLKEGINVTIGFPDWITAPGVSSIPTSPDVLDFFDAPEEALAAAKDKEIVAKKLNEVQTTVGQQYAQMAYLTQAFNSTFVRVSMPVNMTICPGAMVKLNLDEKGELAFYGTVASVNVNFTAGNTALTTVLTLSNIRDSVSIDDLIDNPQKNVGFYKKQWSGKGVMLYAK